MKSFPAWFQLVSALLLIVAGSLRAADAPPAPKRGSSTKAAAASPTTGRAESDAAAKAEKKEEKEPVLSVTKHTLRLGDRTLSYQATAGYLPLKDAKAEKTKANVFFVAYTQLGADGLPLDPARRPVTFSFNGGPGSSSIWLHMGAIGPRRVLMTEKGESLPPPYQMGENEHSWLDLTDLVFIDPVSTGYSRAAAGEDPKQFHGYTEDIASVADFIRLYTTRHQRWASPKFLVGESYGTTRASGLSDFLQQRYGLYLNGICLVSSIMNFQTARFAPGNDLPYLLFLPTYAAGAWYHKKLGAALAGKDLPTVLQVAERFVDEKYAPALMQGERLPDATRRALAREMAELTGLREELLAQRNLRVDIFSFTRLLLEKENRSVGRYDCRLTGIRYSPGTQDSDFDPSYEAVLGSYTACFNDYVRRQLKYESDLPYQALTRDVQPWNYSNVQNQYLNTAEYLHQAMSRNTHLRVWIANGYFDLATPYFATDYTVRQMGLDPAVRGNLTQTFYAAGHMMYMVPTELAKMKSDAARFYADTLRAVQR